MAIVLLTCATGSPGVTTSALALTLCWPRDVLLVDSDRDVSQTVQAGWLGARPLATRGLVELAQAHREMRPVAPLLWDRTVSLLDDAPAGSAGVPDQAMGRFDATGQPIADQRPGAPAVAESRPVARQFLPGFSHPGSVAVFDPVWPEVAEALAGLAGSGVDVIVDAGRVGHQGLPSALLGAADVVLMVVRSSLRSLAAARLHLPPLRERTAALAPAAKLGLLVVGPSRPYSDGDVEAQFGVPVVADMAWQPEEAAVLSEGGDEPRRFRERSFMRSASAAASAVSARVIATPNSFRDLATGTSRSHDPLTGSIGRAPVQSAGVTPGARDRMAGPVDPPLATGRPRP